MNSPINPQTISKITTDDITHEIIPISNSQTLETTFDDLSQNEYTPLLTNNSENSNKQRINPEDQTIIVFLRSKNKTLLRLLIFTIISIFLLLFWIHFIPFAIGTAISFIDLNIQDASISQITENDIQISANILFPFKPFSKIQVYAPKLYVMEYPQENNIIKNDNIIATLHADKVIILPGKNITRASCNLRIPNTNVTVNYGSRIVSEIISKNLEYLKLRVYGTVSAESYGISINNIYIDQIVQINTQASISSPEIQKINKISENSSTKSLEIDACVSINHNLGQKETLEIPGMSFQGIYNNQNLIQVSVYQVVHSQHISKGCFSATIGKIKDSDHRLAIESLIYDISNKRNGIFTIKGLSSHKNSSEALLPQDIDDSKPPKWMDDLISNLNLQVFLGSFESIFEQYKNDLIVPHISLNSGFVGIDGKRNKGFEIYFSAQSIIKVPIPKMKITKDTINLKEISGSFSFSNEKSEKERLTSIYQPLIQDHNPIFKISNYVIPINTNLSTGTLSLDAYMNNISILFNSDNLTGIQSWMQSLFKTRIISGTLEGNVNILIHILGSDLNIRGINLNLPINYKIDSANLPTEQLFSLSPQVNSIRITRSTPELIQAQVTLETINYSNYGFYLSDLATDIGFKGSKMITINSNDMKLSYGKNINVIDVSLHLGKTKSKFENFLSSVSSDNKTSISIQGSPGCTTVVPLEIAMMFINETLTIDPKEFIDSPNQRPIISPIINSVQVQMMTSSVQATITNPVSGNLIYITAIKGKSYYNSSAIGSINKTFKKYYKDGSIDTSDCILLHPNTKTTTPKLRGTVEDTQAIFRLIKDSGGKNVLVDSDVNINILVGGTELSINAFKKDIKVDFSLF
ncbi:hypothetical protein BB559_003811 [Furculomyces boomerangus]|uniref:Uncharacterized protein n=2 Tax=Harpellales TaxID=61421 RepID=A0A2T9YIQ6_9FUNG|nr:hypothetical protein BB559_003811 [Furculomyces boomerangus]PWA03070.1 hypothetical protein BB558_000770 [Smittium angustum]